ncbi:DMT family transporter [Tropicibacter naphthalenivorans]|uniref:Carboxylate/amino acid/amine transporter n=1 Tax=Tropicibacter naphthalenivorans TaxID=441103 RepID=A0A0P1GEE5_9RHOB|nr:DMT family transporter [Tropicibacter naphthalenivorans]CUH79807.1 carboxylate/amino acid/amine transporter [Tropicibacter naphthalenivorans]SMC75296.1 Permease of the drug/metabolite transporter (DMT) superfamily [Tropicibacter naphthalenivorans]
MSSNAQGAIYALIAFGIFATHDVVIKFLGGTYSPFQVIFFSTLMSFPLVSFMLMNDTTHGNLRPVHPWWTAIRTTCAMLNGMCAFYAFSVLPLAQTYAILFASPLLITLISIPLLGEKVGWRRLVAVGVGLLGVLVVLRPGSTELSMGHLAAMGSAVFGAVASIIVRKVGREERSVVLLLYPMAANFVVVGALMLTVYKPMPLPHLGGTALISLLGFIAGLFLIMAYKAGEAAIVAPMQYSQIIWASAYGFFLFNETVDTFTLIGSAIIIGSGVYIVSRESAKGDSQTPVLRTRSRGYGASFRISPFLRSRKAVK